MSTSDLGAVTIPTSTLTTEQDHQDEPSRLDTDERKHVLTDKGKEYFESSSRKYKIKLSRILKEIDEHIENVRSVVNIEEKPRAVNELEDRLNFLCAFLMNIWNF